jgi:hypothetical protein
VADGEGNPCLPDAHPAGHTAVEVSLEAQAVLLCDGRSRADREFAKVGVGEPPELSSLAGSEHARCATWAGAEVTDGRLPEIEGEIVVPSVDEFAQEALDEGAICPVGAAKGTSQEGIDAGVAGKVRRGKHDR